MRGQLQGEFLGHFDRADLRDAADIVAPEIEQHQMFGALLRVGQQFLADRLVLGAVPAAMARAGDRADGDAVVPHTNQNLGARADNGEIGEVEEIEEGRRIDPPQRPVECEGRQREGRLETLRQHDLEDVAGGDIFLRPFDHSEIMFLRRVRYRLGECLDIELLRRMGQRAVEISDDIVETFLGAGIGRLGGDARLGAHRRHQRHLVLHGIEDRDDRRPHEEAVGQAERVRILVRQALHQPHHVVAHITEDAGRHRRQVFRQLDAAFLDEGAQGCERAAFAGLEGVGVEAGLAVDRRSIAPGAPDRIGIEADDRIAVARVAAFNRFQQEAVGLAVGDLQHRRHRRVEIGDKTPVDDLRRAGRIGTLEFVERRRDHSPESVAVSCSYRRVLMSNPNSFW